MGCVDQVRLDLLETAVLVSMVPGFCVWECLVLLGVTASVRRFSWLMGQTAWKTEEFVPKAAFVLKEYAHLEMQLQPQLLQLHPQLVLPQPQQLHVPSQQKVVMVLSAVTLPVIWTSPIIHLNVIK